ncbi:MAG: transporter [Alistipes sp.]|nr:transporter [Alistipes sp.]
MRSIAMPISMVVGALLCYPITAFDEWSGDISTPFFIFSMLFCTFCRVDIREMKPTMLHFWLMVAQVAMTFVVYYTLRPFGDTVAQGGMICALTPMAMGAMVLAGMLGAKVETMATHSLICNLAIAFIAPPLLSAWGDGTCTVTEILMRVTPLLILPFMVAQLCRWIMPKIAHKIGSNSMLSFYLWLGSLVVIMGKTTHFIIESGAKHIRAEILLAVVALVICLVQFGIGHWFGRKYGDKVAGAQALGQKNTVFAIWLSQSFLNPLACVAPTAYIVWQNIVNSYQIYKHR